LIRAVSLGLQVPIAVRLLASASSDLQDHAAWLLANIACESCSHVLEAGALPPLLKLLDDSRQETASEQSLVKTGTWLLSNLCQYTEDFDRVKDCLPRLARLLRSYDEAVLKDACWGLMFVDHRTPLDCFIACLSFCTGIVARTLHTRDRRASISAWPVSTVSPRAFVCCFETRCQRARKRASGRKLCRKGCRRARWCDLLHSSHPPHRVLPPTP
jgi:hypothetical protein